MSSVSRQVEPRVVAVVGSGSGCGKTSLVCALLRSIRDLGAVKISPRGGAARVEWGSGEPGKDTDLFAASGASRVARLVGPRGSAADAWAGLRTGFADCRAIIAEGAGSLEFPGAKHVIFVIRDQDISERSERTLRICQESDTIVINKFHDGPESGLPIDISSHIRPDSVAITIQQFSAADNGFLRLAARVHGFLAEFSVLENQ